MKLEEIEEGSIEELFLDVFRWLRYAVKYDPQYVDYIQNIIQSAFSAHREHLEESEEIVIREYLQDGMHVILMELFSSITDVYLWDDVPSALNRYMCRDYREVQGSIFIRFPKKYATMLDNNRWFGEYYEGYFIIHGYCGYGLEHINPDIISVLKRTN